MNTEKQNGTFNVEDLIVVEEEFSFVSRRQLGGRDVAKKGTTGLVTFSNDEVIKVSLPLLDADGVCRQHKVWLGNPDKNLPGINNWDKVAVLRPVFITHIDGVSVA